MFITYVHQLKVTRELYIEIGFDLSITTLINDTKNIISVEEIGVFMDFDPVIQDFLRLG